MAWIALTPVSDAKGLAKELFEAAIERAGRVWNIVHLMSPNPRVMEASMSLYGVLLHGSSPLTRAQRELLATVVSTELQCHY